MTCPDDCDTAASLPASVNKEKQNIIKQNLISVLLSDKKLF